MRAGFPAAITNPGILLLTTDPAPITVFSPIVTPGRSIVPAPIQQPFFKIIESSAVGEGYPWSYMGNLGSENL